MITSRSVMPSSGSSPGLSDQAVLQHVEHLFLGNVPKSYTSKLWKPNGGQSQYMDSNVVDNSQKAYMIHFIAFLNFIFYPMPHGERMIVPQSTLSHWRSCRCLCRMHERLEYKCNARVEILNYTHHSMSSVSSSFWFIPFHVTCRNVTKETSLPLSMIISSVIPKVLCRIFLNFPQSRPFPILLSLWSPRSPLNSRIRHSVSV